MYIYHNFLQKSFVYKWENNPIIRNLNWNKYYYNIIPFKYKKKHKITVIEI